MVIQGSAVNQPEYWNHRLERYGHTGDSNAIIYAYDQPQRLAAIASAITRVSRGPKTIRRALDVGCGTGDFSQFLLEAGAQHVSALDCSPAVVDFVQRRFQTAGDRFDASCAAIQDAQFAPASFDLIVCVNALQHVLDSADFDRAVGNMCHMAAPGGLLVTCEYSAAGAQDLPPNDYVVVRARKTYVDAFAAHGCAVRGLFGLPRLGVRTCGLVARLAGSLVGGERAPAEAAPAERVPAVDSRARRLQRAAYRAILACTKPLDRALFPFPARLTDMAVVVFEKV